MKDLVDIIKANPGAVFTIDNDDWWMHTAPPKPVGEMTDDEHDEWQENIIAEAGNITQIGNGYGSGNTYGGDVLQALAVIVGVKIESV